VKHRTTWSFRGQIVTAAHMRARGRKRRDDARRPSLLPDHGCGIEAGILEDKSAFGTHLPASRDGSLSETLAAQLDEQRDAALAGAICTTFGFAIAHLVLAIIACGWMISQSLTKPVHLVARGAEGLAVDNLDPDDSDIGSAYFRQPRHTLDRNCARGNGACFLPCLVDTLRVQ